jgi:Uma2 family endonuclease
LSGQNLLKNCQDSNFIPQSSLSLGKLKQIKIMELLIEEEKYTVEDFRKMESLDENYFYELINGEIVKKSSPHFEHQRASGKIFLKLQIFVLNKKLGEVFYAPMDVYLDEFNFYQPDLLYISEVNKGILTEEGIVQGVPDLVIEILSPTTGKYDRGKKMQAYESHGVQEYWIVDLANRIVEVYTNENKRFILHSYCLEKEKVASKLLKDLELSGEEIFV